MFDEHCKCAALSRRRISQESLIGSIPINTRINTKINAKIINAKIKVRFEVSKQIADKGHQTFVNKDSQAIAKMVWV